MAHKFCFEALDRSLTYIMGTTSDESILFGGKVVIFGGVSRGSRSDIVHATINSSYFWHQCKILTLSKNMRLKNNDNASEIKELSAWILNVGDYQSWDSRLSEEFSPGQERLTWETENPRLY
ncbi:hypothetical protein Lal_00033319 [Lupinus albus]|nr:hypothetical protein Lal_00033319 [Lupinus albus]